MGLSQISSYFCLKKIKHIIYDYDVDNDGGVTYDL